MTHNLFILLLFNKNYFLYNLTIYILLPIADKTINAIIPTNTKNIKHITILSVYKFLAKYFKYFYDLFNSLYVSLTVSYNLSNYSIYLSKSSFIFLDKSIPSLTILSILSNASSPKQIKLYIRI